MLLNVEKTGDLIMNKTKYGVEVNIYAYDDNGEVEEGCNQSVGDRNELTKSEACGLAQRLAEHMQELTSKSDEAF